MMIPAAAALAKAVLLSAKREEEEGAINLIFDAGALCLSMRDAEHARLSTYTFTLYHRSELSVLS